MTATMEPLVDTLIEDARWHAFGLGGVAERVASECLVELGLAPDGFSISVLGCNDARIAELNGEFRGKQEPTNVLSWPTEERGCRGRRRPAAAARAGRSGHAGGVG